MASLLLQKIGAAFFPLQDMDDAACLMEAAARVPPEAPDRHTRHWNYMTSKATTVVENAFQISALLGKLPSLVRRGSRFTAVVAQIPPGHGQVIVTSRTVCVVCEGPLEPADAQAHHGKGYCASPDLYTQDGVVDCTLLWHRCKTCGARHYYSYATGGELLRKDESLVYPDWANAKYTHITEHLVWETRLLLRYREQCLHSHSALESVPSSRNLSLSAVRRPSNGWLAASTSTVT